MQASKLVLERGEAVLVRAGHGDLVVNEKGKGQGAVEQIGQKNKGFIRRQNEAHDTCNEVGAVDVAHVAAVHGVSAEDISERVVERSFLLVHVQLGIDVGLSHSSL